MPLWGLAATLAWNLRRHRRGLSTMCSVTRRLLPPRVVVGGWLGLTVWIIQHLLNGYERDRGEVRISRSLYR